MRGDSASFPSARRRTFSRCSASQPGASRRQHQRLEDAGIRVKVMDATPIKAGRSERGKMRTAYFWRVYGEHNAVCFPYFPSHEAAKCTPPSARSMIRARCC